MRRRERVRGLLAASLSTACALVGSVWAQDGATTVLVLEKSSLDKMMVDAKDQAMARALAMIPLRARELPRELHGMPPEASGVLSLVLTAVSRPGTLAVSYNPDNPSGAGFGYGLVFSVTAEDQQEAEGMQSQVNALLVSSGAPVRSKVSAKWGSMLDIPTPAGPVSYGPRQTDAGWRWQVIFGNVEKPEAGLGMLPAPVKGLEPVIRGRLDFAGLTPVMNMVQAFTGQNPDMIRTMNGLREAGMWGENPVKMSFQTGYTAEEARSITVWEGARRFMAAWHMTADPLGPAELSAVPADACWAYVGKGDLSWLNDVLGEVAGSQPQFQEGLDQFTKMTGVDPRADILATLGGAMGVYASDATGGGSFASAVAFIGFKDRERFMAAHEKLRAFANTMADQIPLGPGYVRVMPWKDGEVELFSLRFPGLPVPLELTYAATRTWLIMGLTPQATLAAARQTMGKGDGGLASNAAFAAMMPKGQQALSLSFFDTARAMHAGYPIVSMFGSAVANAVRSPSDPGREPGLVVPTFHELRKGAKASVQFSYWRGDDLVTETRADRSMLVNGTAGAGVAAQVAPLLIVPMMAAQNRRFALLDGASPEVWALAAGGRMMLPAIPTPAMTVMGLIDAWRAGAPIVTEANQEGGR
jgi:hypothetical protein